MTRRLPTIVGEALVLFLVTRAAMLAVVSLVRILVPLDQASCVACSPTGTPELDDWARWDGRWYVDIAEHGYSYDAQAQSSVAFFPLYPLLVRIVASPFGTDHAALVIAGLLISNLALLAALTSIVGLARTELDGRSASIAPLLVLVFPTSVFLSALYPESLMLLLGTSALLMARRGRWTVAGIAAALAVLTKPFGVAVATALLIEAARQRRLDRRALVPLALAPAAGLGWWAYLTALTGEPWAFFITQSKFRHHPALFGAVGELFDPTAYGFPYFVGGLFVLTVAATVLSWRKLSTSAAAYATLVLAFMLGTGTLSSSMRYELNVFPAFFILGALVTTRSLRIPVVAISMVLALLFAAMFGRQYWIG